MPCLPVTAWGCMWRRNRGRDLFRCGRFVSSARLGFVGRGVLDEVEVDGECCGLDRAAEVVALSEVAAQFRDFRSLRGGFDAFGDSVEAPSRTTRHARPRTRQEGAAPPPPKRTAGARLVLTPREPRHRCEDLGWLPRTQHQTKAIARAEPFVPTAVASSRSSRCVAEIDLEPLASSCHSQVDGALDVASPPATASRPVVRVQ